MHRSYHTGKSLRYYKTGPKPGIECPFCSERVIGDLDLHMEHRHQDFWKVIRAYQEVKAWGWPLL